jgi:hypothetical protein
MNPVAATGSFIVSRWRGEVPLGVLLWRDMVVAGTALNILSGLAGIVLIASGAPPAIAYTVYFGLVPWNVFLFLCVWRTAERVTPSEAMLARMVAGVWLVAVIVF